MAQPFITFEAVEYGAVARFCRVVEKERMARVDIHNPDDIQTLLGRFAPQVIEMLRSGGVIPPDERQEFEKSGSDGEAKASAKARMETYHVLEPASVFCPDAPSCILAMNEARAEHVKALRTGASPAFGVLHGVLH